MWILVCLLLVFCLLSWLGTHRAKSENLRLSGEFRSLKENLEDFRASIQKQASDSLEKQLSVFRTTELAGARELARKEYDLKFQAEKSQLVARERAEAVKQSRAVNRGLVAEQLAPHMVNFPYNPKDCHFIGQPVDYVIFSGLDAGKLDRIVLLEVKTGEASMNARERQVRNVVQDARVEYKIFRLETEMVENKG